MSRKRGRAALILHVCLGLWGTSFAGGCRARDFAAFCGSPTPQRSTGRHHALPGRCPVQQQARRRREGLRMEGGEDFGHELGHELFVEELAWYEEQMTLHEDDAALLCGYARFQVRCLLMHGEVRLLLLVTQWHPHDDDGPLGLAARSVRRSQQGCKAVRSGAAKRSCASATDWDRTAQERAVHAG